jgi:hypothetical protein
VSGFGEKVGQRAAVESGLSKLTGLEQRLTGAVKGAVENSEEPESLGGEDGCLVTLDLACRSKQNGRGTAARRWSALCERRQSRLRSQSRARVGEIPTEHTDTFDGHYG